jgi:ferredoxin
MIISLRSLSYEELKARLGENDGVVLWSCDECIKHCGFGGMEQLTVLEDLLEHDGYTVLKKELISRSCFLNLVAKRRDALSESSAIIVLACELGYQCVKTVFNDKTVVQTARTVGVGNFTTFRGPVLTSPLPWTQLEPSVNGYTLKTVSEKLGLYPTFFDAVDTVDLVNIVVDGKPFQTIKGENLLDALQKLGFRIPHLCYDPSLGSIGACRLCMVKIKGRFFPSCCTEVSEGMEIVVNDDDLDEHRRLMLEFIIAENGLDVTKRSSELRYWTRKYKLAETRFKLKTKDQQVDDSSEVMVIDPSLCVLCERCVVACNNVSGQHVIDFAGRGSDTQMITGLNERFSETNCASCMACAHYCPTEAITPKLLFKTLAIKQKPLQPIAPPLAASSTKSRGNG